MATLLVGGKTSVDVPLGKALTVNAAAGIASVVRIPNGGGEPFPPVAVSGSTKTFGPFNVLALFRVECTAGRVDYSVDLPDPAVGSVGGIGWQ